MRATRSPPPFVSGWRPTRDGLGPEVARQQETDVLNDFAIGVTRIGQKRTAPGHHGTAHLGQTIQPTRHLSAVKITEPGGGLGQGKAHSMVAK